MKRRLLLLALLAAACGGGAPTKREPSSSVPAEASGGEVTWAGEVAAILYEHCSDCHHAEGIAPVSLMNYLEVRKRARQISVVTADRYMPPWPPEPGLHRFVGERGLSGRGDRDPAALA